ncbi:MAG: hypothetical protein QXV39_08015, partial [Candidatus Caldarchaeum sp.]
EEWMARALGWLGGIAILNVQPELSDVEYIEIKFGWAKAGEYPPVWRDHIIRTVPLTRRVNIIRMFDVDINSGWVYTTEPRNDLLLSIKNTTHHEIYAGLLIVYYVEPVPPGWLEIQEGGGT